MPKPSIHHPVGRVRLVALAEAVSYLLLLGIAMPLKYLAGMAAAVSVVGAIHGALFVLLVLALILAMLGRHLSLGEVALVFVASLIPFVPFFIDKRLARDEAGD